MSTLKNNGRREEASAAIRYAFFLLFFFWPACPGQLLAACFDERSGGAGWLL